MQIIPHPAATPSQTLRCSLCTAALPAPIIGMRGVPALLGCAPGADSAGDRLVDFNIYVCDICGLIQTDAGFDRGTYEVIHSHAVGGVWERHRERLAAFARSRTRSQQEPPRILEIGPSVNPIARMAAGVSASLNYIDAMPQPPFDLTANERYLAGAFPVRLDERFDLAIASHVAEHAPGLRAFVAGLFDVMEPDATAILSIPDFRAWFEGRYWNAVTSEHLNYPFACQIEALCDELDLTPEFERFDGHSLFIALRRGQNHRASTPREPAAETRALLAAWVSDIQATTGRIEGALRDRTGDVIVAGASHLAQYLTMMSGAVGSRATCVIDNAASKHGARLYGTSLRVAPFNIVAEQENPLVVIPPSPYRDEMTRQVKSLNSRAIVVS